MTTTELVDLIAGYRLFRDRKILITPDDVQIAGTFAQKQICREARLLQDTGSLVLVAAQETYQFPALTVTDATNATPVVLTFSSNHRFNDGDTVFVGAVVGNTASNGKWPSVTKVAANKISLDGSVGNAAYVSGGKAYHALWGALNIIPPVRKVSGGWLNRRDKSYIERYRNHFGASSAEKAVINFYEIYAEPLIVGVQGIPSGAITTGLVFDRRPFPTEDLSDLVDPIIPAQYDKLLELCTLYHVLDALDDPTAQDRAEVIEKKYQRELASLGTELIRRRLDSVENVTGVRL